MLHLFSNVAIIQHLLVQYVRKNRLSFQRLLLFTAPGRMKTR